MPLLGGIRFYPSEKFFIGGRLGFTLGTNTNGGFPLGYLWEPQLGINGKKAQVFAGFDGVNSLQYGFFTLGGILKL